MPTSNTNPQVSPATDKPLGAPGGNEPYKTVRARNWSQDDLGDVKGSQDIYETKRMGDVPESPAAVEPEPKPTQVA